MVGTRRHADDKQRRQQILPKAAQGYAAGGRHQPHCHEIGSPRKSNLIVP
jgi:hypothetical protein